MLSRAYKYTLPHPEDDVSQLVAASLRATKLWRTRFFTLFALYVVSAILVGGVLVQRSLVEGKLHFAVNRTDVKEPYSPVAGQVEYMNRWLTRDPEAQRFMGDPRPELDEAWHEMLEGTLIRVNAEELLMAGNATSVRHRNGGYVAGLGVSHNLHCLKRLKQALQPDYYSTPPFHQWDQFQQHADHCIEVLRQAILCNADLSLHTLEWTPHSRLKPSVRIPQAHVCVNWNRIHQWMKGRSARQLDIVPASPKLYEGTTAI